MNCSTIGAVAALTLAGVALTACSPASTSPGQTTLNFFQFKGEALADFDMFHPDRMVSRILGMGDMLTLIEQAEKTFDAEQSRAAAEKLLKRRTLDNGEDNTHYNEVELLVSQDL